MKNELSFWRWYFRGNGGLPGFLDSFDAWIYLDVSVGVAAACFAPMPLSALAEKMMIPVMAAVVGTLIAITQGYNALVTRDEVRRAADRREGGLTQFLFPALVCVLIGLVTTALWGSAAVGAFEQLKPYGFLWVLVRALCFGLIIHTGRMVWRMMLAMTLGELVAGRLRDADRGVKSAKSSV